MMRVAENLASVRERIALACQRAGRREDEVRLLAVSKFTDTERIYEAIACGQLLFGENRAQELHEKKTFFENHACSVHFIGQLQTNKIKYVCGTAETVESVDRLPLAKAISERAQTLGIVQNIMIQVNIGEETQKGGISDADLLRFTEELLSLGNLRVTGLMCVPPALSPEEVRPYFCRMYQMRDLLKTRFPGLPAEELSMGMSHDFEVAIEEGATIVRVGTGIFGARRVGV